MANETTLTTCQGIFSYADSAHTPRFDDNRVDRDTGEPLPLYSCQFIFDKKNKDFVKKFREAEKAAFKAAVEKGILNAKSFSILKRPLRDGDKELETEQVKDPIYKGKYFFNAATTKYPPALKTIEEREVVDIEDKATFYSGCEGRMLINLYGFRAGNKGIAVGLNGCLKLREGKRLDGRPDVQSAFDKFVDEGDFE